MHFNINRPLFLATIGRAMSVSRRASKTVSAITDSVLLEAREDGTVVVSATDLDITVTSTTGAKVETTGRCLPSASALYEALRSLDGDFVRVRWSHGPGDAQAMMTLREGGADLDVVCRPASDYPTLPSVLAVRFTKADGAPLAHAMRSVLFSASTDESRPNLCGVFLARLDGALTVVTTDGHRLSREVAEVDGAVLDVLDGVLVPTAGVAEVARIETEVGITHIGRLDNNMVFRSDTDGADVVLFVRLIDSNFPDYRQVVPKPHPDTRVTTLNKARLAQALGRMKLGASGANSGVVIEFAPGKASLLSENADRGRALDVVPCDWIAEPMKIGVSVRYLNEAVASLASDRLTIRLNEPLSPILLHAGEGTDDTGARRPVPEAIRIIMPMRI